MDISTFSFSVTVFTISPTLTTGHLFLSIDLTSCRDIIPMNFSLLKSSTTGNLPNLYLIKYSSISS